MARSSAGCPWQPPHGTGGRHRATRQRLHRCARRARSAPAECGRAAVPEYRGFQRCAWRLFLGTVQAGGVGTGFSEKLLASLYNILQKIDSSTCPFVNLPEKRRGRWGSRHHPCSHETLPPGRAGAGAGGSNQVCRVDPGRPASSTCLPGSTN